MKNWEFLMQKEGDRTWQNCSDSPLQISAGHYRLMAHSPYPEQDVEIRITHTKEEDTPSTSKQTQTRRTNSQGLLMVIPYTYFAPGAWEICCTGDIMTELLGNSWQKVLHLQVTPSENSPIPDPLSQEYIDQLERVLQESIEPFLEIKSDDVPSFSLKLEEDTFIRNVGESITINGQIIINQNKITSLPLYSKLFYYLRKTKTGERIYQSSYTFKNQDLLVPFSHTIELSDDPPITFLLGEIILETDPNNCLAKQSFSVSTDLFTQEKKEEPLELTPIDKTAPRTLLSVNHSALPAKIMKDRPNSPRKSVELPPIRPK